MSINTISFTSIESRNIGKSGSEVAVQPILGSIEDISGHIDNGGGVVPFTRTGIDRSGKCIVLITDEFTVTNATDMISTIGEGDYEVSDDNDDIKDSFSALVNVSIISSGGVQVVEIAWAGTIE